MIVKGYQYVRYVDDIRILGKDKSTVQRGLIDFDLELKKYGLVAQVNKTSVHEIDNIEQEITIFRFQVTDAEDPMIIYEDEIKLPNSEQAASVHDFVSSSPTDVVETMIDFDYFNDDEELDKTDTPKTDDDSSTERFNNNYTNNFWWLL